jgi:hypothetical protein
MARWNPPRFSFGINRLGMRPSSLAEPIRHVPASGAEMRRPRTIRSGTSAELKPGVPLRNRYNRPRSFPGFELLALTADLRLKRLHLALRSLSFTRSRTASSVAPKPSSTAASPASVWLSRKESAEMAPGRAEPHRIEHLRVLGVNRPEVVLQRLPCDLGDGAANSTPVASAPTMPKFNSLTANRGVVDPLGCFEGIQNFVADVRGFFSAFQSTRTCVFFCLLKWCAEARSLFGRERPGGDLIRQRRSQRAVREARQIRRPRWLPAAGYRGCLLC